MNHADRIPIKFIPDTGDVLLFSPETAHHLGDLIRHYNEVRKTQNWSSFWRNLTQIERCAINYAVRSEGSTFAAPFAVPILEPPPAHHANCDPAVLDELTAAVTYVQNLFVDPDSFVTMCEKSDFAHDLFLVERYVDVTQALIECKRDNRPITSRLNDELQDIESDSFLGQAVIGIEIALQHHIRARIEIRCSARLAA